MVVEILKEKDIPELHDVIEKTCRISFAPYYPQSVIEDTINSLNCEKLKERAGWTHFYVIKEEDKIVGCGAIGAYWGSLTESSLFTIFVDPDYQGKGYGRVIMETLEADEYAKRASRIEIPASLYAIPFYRHMGYEHKNGVLTFEDNHFALEKFTGNLD
ncbi:MAG: GNAT family N-acetyltransferase [Clostridia bacterium]|nr:GNAT family N-acetyltransferase [Clostridia bacterium]